MHRYSEDPRDIDNVDVYPLPPSSLGGKECPEPASAESSDSSPLSDEDFFMNMACLAARRSKDPSRQVSEMNT